MEPSPILIIVGSGQIQEDGRPDKRLYSSFCVGCGQTDEIESDDQDCLVCHHCGHDTFKHLRDEEMQVAIIEQTHQLVKSGMLNA